MNRLFVLFLTLTALSGSAATAQSPSASRPVPALDDAFKRVDANKDAKLDAQEFGRFIERSRSLSGANAVEVFGKLDANKDGALTVRSSEGSLGSLAAPRHHRLQNRSRLRRLRRRRQQNRKLRPQSPHPRRPLPRSLPPLRDCLSLRRRSGPCWRTNVTSATPQRRKA